MLTTNSNNNGQNGYLGHAQDSMPIKLQKWQKASKSLIFSVSLERDNIIIAEPLNNGYIGGRILVLC